LVAILVAGGQGGYDADSEVIERLENGAFTALQGDGVNEVASLDDGVRLLEEEETGTSRKNVASREEAYASATAKAMNMVKAGAKAIMKDQRLSYSSGKGFDQHQINTMAKKIKKTNDALSFDANMAKS